MNFCFIDADNARYARSFKASMVHMFSTFFLLLVSCLAGKVRMSALSPVPFVHFFSFSFTISTFQTTEIDEGRHGSDQK